MADISINYISKVLVNNTLKNDDVVTVTTQYFSPEGDVYELRKELIEPSVIQTDKELTQLEPEVSNVYPYKVVVPTDVADGSSIIYSQGITDLYAVTASQNYYTAIYFERYTPEIINAVDRGFYELSVEELDADSFETDIVGINEEPIEGE